MTRSIARLFTLRHRVRTAGHDSLFVGAAVHAWPCLTSFGDRLTEANVLPRRRVAVLVGRARLIRFPLSVAPAKHAELLIVAGARERTGRRARRPEHANHSGRAIPGSAALASTSSRLSGATLTAAGTAAGHTAGVARPRAAGGLSFAACHRARTAAGRLTSATCHRARTAARSTVALGRLAGLTAVDRARTALGAPTAARATARPSVARARATDARCTGGALSGCGGVRVAAAAHDGG
jgi:hypothetical protein